MASPTVKETGKCELILPLLTGLWKESTIAKSCRSNGATCGWPTQTQLCAECALFQFSSHYQVKYPLLVGICIIFSLTAISVLSRQLQPSRPKWPSRPPRPYFTGLGRFQLNFKIRYGMSFYLTRNQTLVWSRSILWTRNFRTARGPASIPIIPSFDGPVDKA